MFFANIFAVISPIIKAIIPAIKMDIRITVKSAEDIVFRISFTPAAVPVLALFIE